MVDTAFHATLLKTDEAIETLARGTFEVIVTDLRMPAGDGAKLLSEARSAGIAESRRSRCIR